MRAQIVEGEDLDSARRKLSEAVAQHVPDPSERECVEPRLAHLLGLEERQVHEREDLFAGWRLFFERLAEQTPVVLVFDDMHWTDPSLLDFVEYLLEWSRNLAAVGGEPEDQLEPLLTALVRKEMLSLQSDPRSPERGQCGFLQDLVRFVA
jgi:AAA ATPase domain